jgi:hypothetical protein
VREVSWSWVVTASLLPVVSRRDPRLAEGVITRQSLTDRRVQAAAGESDAPNA